MHTLYVYWLSMLVVCSFLSKMLYHLLRSKKWKWSKSSLSGLMVKRMTVYSHICYMLTRITDAMGEWVTNLCLKSYFSWKDKRTSQLTYIVFLGSVIWPFTVLSILLSDLKVFQELPLNIVVLLAFFLLSPRQTSILLIVILLSSVLAQIGHVLHPYLQILVPAWCPHLSFIYMYCNCNMSCKELKRKTHLFFFTLTIHLCA